MIEFLKSATGWWRVLIAMMAGVAAALSLPPYDFWLLLFVAVPVVLLMLENLARSDMRKSFLLGWCFGFGYFLFAFHWIGFAFLVDSKNYLWMMPFAVGGLSAAMAIYWGLAFLCVTLTGFKHLPMVLIFASAIGVAEVFRGILFTGFPWASPGLAVDGMGGVMQTASIWGMGGLSVLVVLWAGVWPYIFDRQVLRSQRLVALIILLTLPLSWIWGSLRLRDATIENVAGINIRIVQPNIWQARHPHCVARICRTVSD
jgi:apolipoprotein N-acyltransferase